MLELVVGQRLGLGIVALGDRLEKRLACVVVSEPLLDDRPADRRAVLDRRELVADGRRVRPIAPKRSGFPTSVRMSERQSVAGGPRLCVQLLDSLYEPAPALEHHNRPRRQRVLAGVWPDALTTSAVAGDDLVRDGQVAGSG